MEMELILETRGSDRGGKTNLLEICQTTLGRRVSLGVELAKEA